uniref:HTH-type transcriptional regulator n=1 Tax=uncultured bacterium B3TF_MPn1 TaxID=1439866 RepID=W0NTL9_9BACT|nr:COG1510 Predicted transcriptional regulators [uncultured bacterium B3TF_MPn1]
MNLSHQQHKFIRHFGEMGSRWGINRTVGQIYALLVINKDALFADQIAEALSISRGNVSMGIKELQSWRLVNVTHKPGDRKDYYYALSDVWAMARAIFEERRKREIEPTLSVLRDILLEGAKEQSNEQDAYAEKRMQDILALLEMVTQWSVDLQKVSPESLRSLMKMGAGAIKMLEVKDKVKGSVELVPVS